MSDKPTLHHGEWKRPSERRREWQAKWDALDPAERVAFDVLPYSSIPDLEDAQEVVAEVKPHVYREAAERLRSHAAEVNPGPFFGNVVRKETMKEVANWLSEQADQLKRETDGG